MNEKKLLDLKKEIEDAKIEVSKSKGKLEHLFTQLKEQWQCSSVKEAQKQLATLNTSLGLLDQNIQKLQTELEEKYGIS